MSVSAVDQVGRLLRGREVQFRAVAITALCSYFLQLFGIWLHWQLWAIALATILPWIPLFTMKVLWTSKHYGFMAIYLVIMVLQVGHVGEHVVQMLQFIFIYNPADGCFGWSYYGVCKDAHGVFGELDRELVHFVWDGLIIIATLIVRIHFRKVKNVWLTLAVVAAAIHQIEHIYLFGIYLFDNNFYQHGGYIFGVHVLTGLDAQNGIMGHNGVVGSLIGRDSFFNALLPSRINIHFIYNTLVLIPMLIGFKKQVERIYDEWLATAIPQLSEEQLIAATLQSENVKFAMGQNIFKQGDAADRFYIITKGQADVIRVDKRTGAEIQVARLSEGQYFGEIGLLGNTGRTATVRAVTDLECLAMTRDVLKEMLASSSEAYKEVDVVLRRRMVQLGALQGLPIQDSVNADSDTILKTRMIRDRLKMLQPDDISRIFSPVPVVNLRPAYNQARPVQPAFNQSQPTQPRPAQPVQAGNAIVMAEMPTIVNPTPTPTPSSTNIGYYRGVLMVRTGPSAGLRFEIQTPRIIIGRRGSTSMTDITTPMMFIDDGRISRNHLEISAKPDGLYARDLGSANGTWVNGRQLGGDPTRLEDGADIVISPDTTLNFRMK